MLAAWACLLLRLALVMLVPDWVAGVRATARWQDHIRARAELEHLRVVRTDDGRGRILFRNLEPWSGRRWEGRLALGRHLLFVAWHDERRRGPLWDPLVGTVGAPDVWPARDRAVPEQGQSGLVYAWDDWLHTGRPAYVAAWRPDEVRRGAPAGEVWQMPARPGWDVVTTIDPAWQEVASRALRQAGVPRGAVVVIDVATRDVLAAASWDANRPQRVVALEPAVPGSVFKLVTMAAALESLRLRPQSWFYCPGQFRAPGVRLRCWRAHGGLTLREALAASCDVAFAAAGLAVGAGGIAYLSHRLHLDTDGLARAGGRPALAGLLPGRVFLGTAADDGRIANTAIGQQDVRISPLAAANLAACIASGGWVADARLVRGLAHGGRVRIAFPPAARLQALSAWTAAQVGRAMRDAVISPRGTARALADAPLAVAAKTGTAELGTSPWVNGWLVGFMPYGQPRIAFCAFAERLPSAAAHRAVVRMAAEIAAAAARFEGGSLHTALRQPPAVGP